MSKIKLVLRPNEFTSFVSLYIRDLVTEFFEIEDYDQDKTYDRTGTLFVISEENVGDPWAAEMQSRGYKVAVDNLWERPAKIKNNFYWLEHKYWFWWYESIWWRGLKQSSYIPQRDIKYIGFMPIRSQKPFRDRVVNDLEDLLPKMLWSYVAKYKRLELDINDFAQGQRYMHPSWYDQTYCSLVIETDQRLPLFVTEKSYKPLAYYHPCLIIGAPGVLDFLKQAGFETFDNMFDETYDSDPDVNSRLKIIYENLRNIDITKKYDALTEQKLKHNHAHFFNETLTKNGIRQEILRPLVEYAET